MKIAKGTWAVDPSHSSVNFQVKHLMISKVKGRFTQFEGFAYSDGENILNTKLEGTVYTTSIDTNDTNRDNHLRSADFFDSERYPIMTLKSQGLTPTNKENIYHVDALLTIKDITKPVMVTVDFGGIAKDPFGNVKGAAEATFKIDRTEFGLTWNTALETGGVLVGNEITVTLDIQATLQE